MKITIHLPVTPAIKKYLEGRFGKNYHLSLDDWFGCILVNIFENKNYRNYSIQDKKQKRKTETYDITMSTSMAEKNGFIVEMKHEYLINNIIDSIFREDLYMQCLVNKKEFQIEYQTTINTVFDMYDITEDDYSVESIKRDLTRKREKIESKLFI